MPPWSDLLPPVQAALRLSEPQVSAVCEAYEAMSASLNGVYNEQKAMISSISRPQQHGLMGEQVICGPLGCHRSASSRW